jgi:hypothetical protein
MKEPGLFRLQDLPLHGRPKEVEGNALTLSGKITAFLKLFKKSVDYAIS